ncbi:hypothetical protein YC2023_099968 [Brassica napus]
MLRCISFSWFYWFYTLLAASHVLHYCRHDQRDALREFPINGSNSNPFLSSWNKSSDGCFWEGITWDVKSREDISLYLNNQFTGESSLVLLNLTTDISNNLFKSTLPADMSRFHNLVNFVCGWQVGNSFLDLFLHLRS